MRICVDEPFEDLEKDVVRKIIILVNVRFCFGCFHLSYLSVCAYMTIDLNTIVCTLDVYSNSVVTSDLWETTFTSFQSPESGIILEKMWF